MFFIIHFVMLIIINNFFLLFLFSQKIVAQIKVRNFKSFQLMSNCKNYLQKLASVLHYFTKFENQFKNFCELQLSFNLGCVDTHISAQHNTLHMMIETVVCYFAKKNFVCKPNWRDHISNIDRSWRPPFRTVTYLLLCWIDFALYNSDLQTAADLSHLSTS